MKQILTALALLLSTIAYAETFTFMGYNAENLFDTRFDQGTEDFTYLPLSVKKTLAGHKNYCSKLDGARKNECLQLDWTDAKLLKKVQGIARVIKAFDKTGKGPDVLAFEEIENVNALNILVSKGLTNLGYRYVTLIEGDDSRGIDVGVISKYPVTSSKHHSVFVNGERLDTRGILEVNLNVNGRSVVVFANHWPSQSNPAEHRVASAELLEKIAATKSVDLIIAAGDFNTIDTDSPYPFDFMHNFMDTEALARRQGHKIHPGTHYFKGEWTSLDRIFVHKKSKLVPELSTFTIFHHDFIMKKDTRTGDMVPYRFSHETAEGFSDHLPVGLTFKY